MKKQTCLIYTRTSTASQDSGNQLQQLREYAEKQSWHVMATFEDVDSGARPATERMKEVFDLARKRKFDILLFWSLDRFSREGSRKTLEYLTLLDSCGVKWHSFTEGYISSLGVFGDAIISILAALAKQERIRISERTKAGLARMRAAGKILGRPKTSPERIQQARKLRKEGHSFSDIGKAMGITRERAFQMCNIKKKAFQKYE